MLFGGCNYHHRLDIWVIRTCCASQKIAHPETESAGMRASQSCDTDLNVWKNLFISKLTFCFLFVEDTSPLISLALSAVWWRQSYLEECWNDVNRWKAQSGGLWLNSTRHSTMTRINKNSYGCNADSLCSICSPADVWTANMISHEIWFWISGLNQVDASCILQYI